MPTPFSPSVFALSVTLAISLLGCGTTPGPTEAPSPTATVRTVPTADELTSALRFRTTFGLRADEAWIRAVFADPASDNGQALGVPLMPDEVAKVLTAQAAANATTDLVAAYGATVPQDWAGMFVDQQAGGTVVARFKAHVVEHRAALLALLPAGAKVEVRSAAWSDQELQDLAAQVEQERDWFPTIGTELYAVDIGGLDDPGRLRVRFNGPMAAAAAIEAHFGNPPWMRADWIGPLEWTGRRGILDVYTRDAAGRPVSRQIVLDSLDDRVDVSSDVGFSTDKRGHLRHQNLPAVTYRVQAIEGNGDDGIVVVAEGLVTVPADGRISLHLTVN